MSVIFVQQGDDPVWIGETVALQTDFQDENGNNMLDAEPSAVGTAVLYDPTGTDVTSGQASGTASLSAWVLTWPSFTPTSKGLYHWYVDLTVNGNTQKTGRRMRVRELETTE